MIGLSKAIKPYINTLSLRPVLLSSSVMIVISPFGSSDATEIHHATHQFLDEIHPPRR
jgi:hypothetical protein